MAANPDHYLHALILLTVGCACLCHGLFLKRIRSWRMRRFRRESGASMEQVQAWFSPSHDAVSDLFARVVSLAAAYPALVIGAGSVCDGLNIRLPPMAAWVSPVLSYSLGGCAFLVFAGAALLFLVSAERIAGGYVLSALPRNGYDYARAERSMRGWGRSGPAFSVMSRVFGLIMLAIAGFIGHMIADTLTPLLHTWLGR